MLLPIAAVLGIIASDVLSLVLVPNWVTGNWFVSPFRPLGQSMWSGLAPHDKVVVVLLEGIAIGAATAVILMSLRIREFQRSTRITLDDYRSLLEQQGVIPQADSES